MWARISYSYLCRSATLDKLHCKSFLCFFQDVRKKNKLETYFTLTRPEIQFHDQKPAQYFKNQTFRKHPEISILEVSEDKHFDGPYIFTTNILDARTFTGLGILAFKTVITSIGENTTILTLGNTLWDPWQINNASAPQLLNVWTCTKLRWHNWGGCWGSSPDHV